MTNPFDEYLSDPRKRRLARPLPPRRPRKRAKTFTQDQIQHVEACIAETRARYSNLLVFRLSVYAGLRVGEIVDMMIDTLVDRDGEPEPFVHVVSGKGGRSRKIPMHPKIAEAVRLFVRHHPNIPFVAFSHRWHTPKRQTLTALTNYLWDFYQKIGLPGYTSHSGRRTFITNLARSLGDGDFTLRDVQMYAGHVRLDTTECYIDPSPKGHNLIERLQ